MRLCLLVGLQSPLGVSGLSVRLRVTWWVVFLGEAEGLDGEEGGLGEVVVLGEAMGFEEPVGDANADASGDAGVPGGVGVIDGDGEGVGVARISCHCQSSPVYPPISFKSSAQRSCILGKSGGPGWLSALPGNTR
jgi:hypothetical protein